MIVMAELQCIGSAKYMSQEEPFSGHGNITRMCCAVFGWSCHGQKWSCQESNPVLLRAKQALYH